MMRRPVKARGTILVLVLVLVAVLSIVAVSELFLASSELGAATAAERGLHARAAAMSGIERAIALLWSDLENVDARTDRPDIFQAQLTTSEGQEPWYFTVFADNLEDQDHIRYGIEDEAAKINLNTADPQTLLGLPGMTQELADCLLDYTDSDKDKVRPQGAEQDYYDTLPVPYQIRNGPLSTVEELLLVKGFNGSIVYGEDANCNGMLDANENDSDASFPPDDGDGQLNRGLRPFVTVNSYEPNLAQDKSKRININTGTPQEIAAGLQPAGVPGAFQQTAAFVAAARLQNVTFTDPSQLLDMELEVDNPRVPGQKIRLQSGVTDKNLATVLDKLTTGGTRRGQQEVLEGRVSIYTAPKAVLSLLPGLNDELAQRIVDMRRSVQGQDRTTTAWLLTQNVVNAEGFKKVAPWITVHSYQFRVRSLGYSPAGGRFCVLEAIVDLAGGKPQVTYLRDVTRRGMPFPVTGTER